MIDSRKIPPPPQAPTDDPNKIFSFLFSQPITRIAEQHALNVIKGHTMEGQMDPFATSAVSALALRYMLDGTLDDAHPTYKENLPTDPQIIDDAIAILTKTLNGAPNPNELKAKIAKLEKYKTELPVKT